MKGVFTLDCVQLVHEGDTFIHSHILPQATKPSDRLLNIPLMKIIKKKQKSVLVCMCTQSNKEKDQWMQVPALFSLVEAVIGVVVVVVAAVGVVVAVVVIVAVTVGVVVVVVALLRFNC